MTHCDGSRRATATARQIQAHPAPRFLLLSPLQVTVSSTAVANGIAAICLAVRDQFGLVPHAYFDWTEGSPLAHVLRFILRGSGEVAPVTREVLRRAEPDRSRRPTCTSADAGTAGPPPDYRPAIRDPYDGDATLARIASPRSAGLVNCGQWPVGRSTYLTSRIRASSLTAGCPCSSHCLSISEENSQAMTVTGTS